MALRDDADGLVIAVDGSRYERSGESDWSNIRSTVAASRNGNHKGAAVAMANLVAGDGTVIPTR
jgi:hypothetical protein